MATGLGGCTRAAPGDAELLLDLPDTASGGLDIQIGGDSAADTASSDAANGAPDSGAGDAPTADGSASGSSSGATADTAGSAWDAVTCAPGAQACKGALLATCAPDGDGWATTPCFAGMYCRDGGCHPLENNLLIAFDTSGSMAATVKGVKCNTQVFPNCDPKQSCTRMAVSKLTFGTALANVDDKTTRLALFRFPQRLASTSASTCSMGFYAGLAELTTDSGQAQHVTEDSSWYWNSLHQVLCVDYPRTDAEALTTKQAIGRWMDGVEKIAKKGVSCSKTSANCSNSAACGAGACCDTECWAHTEPELRSNGSTPIGKTLFYIGEYMKNRVVVDGRSCIVPADCQSPNYTCQEGRCVDPARGCRQNVVVLFTDGGQQNDPTYFFSPQVAAKRLRYGLRCKVDADCAGDGRCGLGKCLPPADTGYHCLATSQPCKPGITDPQNELFCPGLGGAAPECIADIIQLTTAQAKLFADNVLRSPDGEPFAVTLHVVDISGAASLKNSFHLAVAGGGRMLTADVANASALLSVLESAFDMKNKKVCGSKTQ